MSVENISNMALHGAGGTKSGGGIKGGHDAHGAGDGSGAECAFGALLASLGVQDVEPNVATSTVPLASDEQPKVDMSSDGSAFIALAAIVQVAPHPVRATSIDGAVPLPVTAVNVEGAMIGSAQNVSLVGEDALHADGVGMRVADALFTSVVPGSKQGFRSPGQIDSSQIPDAIGSGNVGFKAARISKDRGHTESTSTATTVPIQSANASEPSRLDMRVISEKAEFLGRAIAAAAEDVVPMEVVQLAELRRDKIVFKVNSTTTGADVSSASGPDAKPANLNLEGMAPDVGAGMTQGDQNPGTYWMSSDMKNAEMKLDGFGESPVEVSISVQGNQAHVAFRTDEAQTRLALEDAGATLKDMLSKEGLNLAGVSVGTSDAGGDGAQDRRSRQEGRPALTGNLGNKFPSGTSGHIVTTRVGHLDVFV